MEYEWNEEKNRSNRAKHHIRFETAVGVFDDPFELTEFDQFIDGEERWKTIGTIPNWSVLVVIYVERDREDVAVTRIISARAATKEERKRYERHRRKDR